MTAMSVVRALGIGLLLGICVGLGTLSASAYAPGDADANGIVNVSDAVFLVTYIFAGGPEPIAFRSADVTDDCMINIGDAVRLIAYIFDSNQPPLSLGCAHSDIRGQCLESPGKEMKGDSAESFLLEVIGDDLHVRHLNALYQCCLAYRVDYVWTGAFQVTATESDTGAPCDCLCYFNLESILYDLDAGEYVVTLIHADGDTVGVDTATVPAGLIGYDVSGCLDKGDKGGKAEPPIISYSYSGGVLNMSHTNALFNCAADLVVSFEQVADTLRFYEINISHQFAWCECHFGISAQVAGIPPGQYVAEVHEQQTYFDPFNLVDRRVISLGK